MIHLLIQRYPSLRAVESRITSAARAITDCFRAGGKLLACGNGGSCSDSDHIVGELMKGFLRKRPLSELQKSAMKSKCPMLTDECLQKLQGALPAISLPSATSLNTAFCNDVDPDLVFAQSVLGLGKPNDILICISTSGNSANVVAAAEVASSLGLVTVGLTGQDGGQLAQLCDICICVPATETYQVQELHLPVYHYLCAFVESELFPM